DTIVIQRNDTIIELIRPGSTARQGDGKKIEEILENNSERSFFSRKLHEWLVKSSIKKNSSNPGAHLDELEKYEGKNIRNIDIRHIPPFGGSVDDTIAVGDSWLARVGNRFRFETAAGIIMKTITLENNQSLSPIAVYDSERLLRGLSFINDARLRVWQSPANPEAVNISIYVQDRYPHAITAGMMEDQPSVSLINKNLLGRGLSLAHTLVMPSADYRDWGFRETLGAENFLGEYIDLEIDFARTKKYHLIAGKMEKEFVIPEIKYAGGLHVNRSFTNPNIPDYPAVEWEPPLDFRRQNFWAGRSFQIGQSDGPLRSNLYITGRYLDLKMFSPLEPADFIPDGQFYYGGLSFSRRGYYKNNLIHSFGRTEDVPYGSLTSLSIGYHKDENYTRHFAGFHYSFGKALIPSRGYLFFKSDIGSFFRTGSPEQGHIKIGSEYITPLISVGKSKLRNFLEIEYANGLNRFPGEYLFIDEETNGLHRFDFAETIRGDEKIVFKTEQVFFTQLEPLGFKFAVFSFFDSALLRENQEKNIFQQTPYFSFGGGLRIRNDNLVFNTLQIRLAIMPRVPKGILPMSLRITGEQPRKFRDFVPSQPGSPVYF
ncbi:MAG: hypothetical protein ACOC1E_03430, partial [Marinilabiliaceae bacterium]